MSKRILVQTDDPAHSKIYLTIRGAVEKIVDIHPKTVSMKGAPGEELETIVTITPMEKYLFSILDLKQQFKKNITAELIQPNGDDRSWKVRIKSNSPKPDTLYEVITLNTDSKYRPSLRIRVYAIYSGQKKS